MTERDRSLIGLFLVAIGAARCRASRRPGAPSPLACRSMKVVGRLIADSKTPERTINVDVGETAVIDASAEDVRSVPDFEADAALRCRACEPRRFGIAIDWCAR